MRFILHTLTEQLVGPIPLLHTQLHLCTLKTHLNATVSATLLPLCIMPAMHSRPLSSWSATRRKRSRGRATAEAKEPSGATEEWASRSAVRGTRTWSNHSCAGLGGTGMVRVGVWDKGGEEWVSRAVRGTRTWSNSCRVG